MVRHNVDTNQPRSLVILDTRAASYSSEAFEDAVRAAASIVMASATRGFEFRLITTDGLELTHRMPAPTIMDRLAEVGLSFRGNTIETLEQVRSDLGGVSLTLITGSIAQEELAQVSRFQQRFDVITVAQFTAGTNDWDRGLPDATVLTASSSEEFARAWNQVTRRS